MTERDDVDGGTGDTVNAFLMVARARAVTRRWNERFPKAQVPVEWAEEAALAWAAAETLGATMGGLECQRHALEFTTKLPVELLECIFNGRDLPEELP